MDYPIYSASVWQVKPGNQDVFKDEWEANTRAQMQVPGAVEAILLQDKQNPHRFISISPWESEDSIAGMRSVPGFREWVARARELCEDYNASAFTVAARLTKE